MHLNATIHKESSKPRKSGSDSRCTLLGRVFHKPMDYLAPPLVNFPLKWVADVKPHTRSGQGYHLRSLILLLVLSLTTQIALAQASSASALRLPRDRFKSGDGTLHAFEPVSKATRHSVVKLDLDGSTVALAAVIDTNGLAVTKGSEIKTGKLTAWLATGKEVDVELIGIDEENDVALVKVHAKGLLPIQWATEEVWVGQWVVTPGIAETPQAIGIISVPPRKIRPTRALIGVQLDFNSPTATIGRIMQGFGAEQAGLKPGDHILAVNDQLVNEGKELIKTLRDFREGQLVKLRVQRDEKEFDASVKMMTERAGRGFDRADRMNRMGGEPSQRAEGFAMAIQHDTVLQAWQCGGPLVNLEGKAIGLNIARAGRVASYALPAQLVTQSILRLGHEGRTNQRSETLKTSQPVATPAQ